ncbi:hypothetical protein CLV24_109110 [Pontibacter ummariensis]|uniref:Uncharacterized protein n=1 Tax=Pontibacter ummariensis TaxID=1610492 RepID=A0A239FP70_9BACT|nr:hypothetical protein CLV24_109110 [Pontibacter ummariensis]SNS58629.1 hypothetical protein SAMN06296052_10960 [Pontibacter ummariensis]
MPIEKQVIELPAFFFLKKQPLLQRPPFTKRYSG